MYSEYIIHHHNFHHHQRELKAALVRDGSGVPLRHHQFTRIPNAKMRCPICGQGPIKQLTSLTNDKQQINTKIFKFSFTKGVVWIINRKKGTNAIFCRILQEMQNKQCQDLLYPDMGWIFNVKNKGHGGDWVQKGISQSHGTQPTATLQAVYQTVAWNMAYESVLLWNTENRTLF